MSFSLPLSLVFCLLTLHLYPFILPSYVHREMEELMHRLGGFIFSYGISFTTRTEFWERWYDPNAYARFRELTRSEDAFPDVFDKIGGGKKVKHLE